MAPKKLTESDKQDILNRYRQSEETAASLATQYGVSTSTVSRLLKQSIPEDEYEALIQQKRSGSRTTELDDLPNLDAISAALAVVLKADREAQGRGKPEIAPAIEPPRQRKRPRTTLAESAAVEFPADAVPVPAPVLETQMEVPLTMPQSLESSDDEAEKIAAFQSDAPESEISNPDLLDEGLEDDLDEDDDLDDLDDLDDEDDEDDEDDDLSSDAAIEIMHVQGKGRVNVLPLSEAQIPRTCYVVVDRSAELITRPLKDFADLGQIPPEDVQERTLPVFDNHRVAKRFLRRMQRIVKVPDGRMFQKVTPYLQAKGITRLLIDGQIYSI